MIEFRFVLVPDSKHPPRKNIKDYKSKYPDILYICGEFTIIICDDIFFSEPQFPVIEFLTCLENWIETKVKNSNMNYVSIETEENPLISFVYENGYWKIESKWQKFNCDRYFLKNELTEATYLLKKSVNAQLVKQ